MLNSQIQKLPFIKAILTKTKVRIKWKINWVLNAQLQSTQLLSLPELHCTPFIRLLLCKGVCLLACSPSARDDTDTLCCQISNICHSSLPKVKTNMLIYCLLQAALRMRAGERARYILCSLLRATCFPPSRLCCPAHAWLISPLLSWQSLRYTCTKGVSMNSYFSEIT